MLQFMGSQRVGHYCVTELKSEELMLFKCGAGEDSRVPLDSKEIKPVNAKGNQP